MGRELFHAKLIQLGDTPASDGRGASRPLAANDTAVVNMNFPISA